MSRRGYAVLALVAAGLALILFAWLDADVLQRVQREGAADFNASRFTLLVSLASILLASAILGLGCLAWRAASAWIGAAYFLVGGFFALLPAIVFGSMTGASSVFEPLIRMAAETFLATTGPINAVVLLGAGMFVVGLVSITRSLRDRPRTRAGADQKTSVVSAPG